MTHIVLMPPARVKTRTEKTANCGACAFFRWGCDNGPRAIRLVPDCFVPGVASGIANRGYWLGGWGGAWAFLLLPLLATTGGVEVCGSTNGTTSLL